MDLVQQELNDQYRVVSHNCSHNLATCSGGIAPNCPLCEGGYILENSYTYIQLFQLLKYVY